MNLLGPIMYVMLTKLIDRSSGRPIQGFESLSPVRSPQWAGVPDAARSPCSPRRPATQRTTQFLGLQYPSGESRPRARSRHLHETTRGRDSTSAAALRDGPRIRRRRLARLAPHREPHPLRGVELERSLVARFEQVAHRYGAVDPDVQPLVIESEPDEDQDRRLTVGLVHRPGDFADLECSPHRATRSSSSLPRRAWRRAAPSAGSAASAAPGRNVAHEQFVRHRLSAAAGRRSAGAGGTGRRTRGRDRTNGRRRTTRTSRCLRRSGLLRAPAPAPPLDAAPASSASRASGQLAPGPLVVGVANPDVEVRVDPRAREDARQLAAAPRGTPPPSSPSAAPDGPRVAGTARAETAGRRPRNVPRRSRRRE